MRFVEVENRKLGTSFTSLIFFLLVSFKLEVHISIILFLYFLGVYFSSRVEKVKFVDFCGKYRLPLLQYLCSPTCWTKPFIPHSDTDTDDEDSAREKLKRVLLG